MLTLGSPIDASPAELALIRCGYAYLLHRCLKRRPRYWTQPKPVSIARLVDLTALARPDVHRGLTWFARVALCLYIAGIGMPLVTLLLCVCLVARESLDNSQGAIEHAWNAVALVLLAQTLLYGLQVYNAVFPPVFWPADGVGRPRVLGLWGDTGATYDQLALFWSQQSIVAVYFTAALSKLLVSGIAWVKHAPRIALQVIKAGRESYYTGLDASHLDRPAWAATQALRHPHLTRVLLASGLMVELLSPLFLYNRIANVAGGTLLILFHLGNTRYLRLPFKEQQLIVGVFFLQVPFGLVTLAGFFGISP